MYDTWVIKDYGKRFPCSAVLLLVKKIFPSQTVNHYILLLSSFCFSSDFGDYTNYTFVILLTKTKRKAHQIGSLKTNPGLYMDTTAHNSHCVWIYISCSTERSLPAEQNIHSV